MVSDALSDVTAILDALGYAPGALVRDYPVWLGQGRGIAHADLVAFAHSVPRDMSTAVIAVEAGRPESGFELARLLAAPYFLVLEDEVLDLWLAGTEAPVLWRSDIGLPDVPELRDWLRPESAMKSKVGLRQLPLFDLPVDFLAQARSDSADRLAPLVAGALTAATEELSARPGGKSRTTRLGHRAAARLVVGALTALVLRDREPPFLKQLAPTDLVMQVSADHPSTFRWVSTLTEQEQRLLVELIDALGSGVNYQSLDPSVLSYVYEEALVDEADRHNLGIFYTPPKLATRLSRSLPLELIHPEERYVLDPACGSGTLLMAAHDRLRDLQPADWSTGLRHDDLAVHVRGFDVDPFAAEIAQLALFLHAQPLGNGWQIDSRNTLTEPLPAPQPRLIVTNPPWRYTPEIERTQAADSFVEWSVDAVAPGGLLGLLLPGSWLGSRSSAAAREKLTTECEVFELWRLAQGAFANSRSATVVVLARKLDGLGGRGARAITEVSRRQLQRFLDGAGPWARYLQPNAAYPLDAGPTLPKLGVDTVQLGTVTTIRSGQQPLAGAQDRSDGTPFLNQFRDVRVYGLVEQSVLRHLAFPDDFAGPWGAGIISKKKVLASAARSSEGPWRFRVAIDPLGVSVRNSMRGIAPNDQDDEELLFALAILVGSAFASTFAASFVGDRNISAKVLPAMPVPRNRDSIEALGRLGRQAALAENKRDLNAVLVEAEDAVWLAYGVSENDRRLAEARFYGEPAPEGYLRYIERAPSRSRSIVGGEPLFRRVGAVLDVDGPYVRIWVNGLTPSDGIALVLPPNMPGWMARPGATFDVRGVAELGDLANGVYTFQPMAWQDIDIASSQPEPVVLE